MGAVKKQKITSIIYIMYPKERKKMNRQELNLIKAYKNLNQNIDKDIQNLYDKLDHLKLSHNRKVKALIKIKEKLENCPNFHINWPMYYDEVIKIIDDALICCGRMKGKRNGRLS